jgi:DNA-binding MarR family transcriptional regulator
MPDKEWYTQQEIAEMLGVTLDRVRSAVTVLDNAKIIRTARDPKDRRYIVVHTDSIDKLKQAILGDAG